MPTGSAAHPGRLTIRPAQAPSRESHVILRVRWRQPIYSRANETTAAAALMPKT